MGYPAAKIKQFLEAIEPEVIIECPSCQTKFRIEASKLQSSSTALDSGTKAKAKFHCSRCDYVFSAEVASKEINQENSELQNSDSSDHNTSSDLAFSNIRDNIAEQPTHSYTAMPEEQIEQEDQDKQASRIQNQQLAFNFETPAGREPSQKFNAVIESDIETTRVVDDFQPFLEALSNPNQQLSISNASSTSNPAQSLNTDQLESNNLELNPGDTLNPGMLAERYKEPELDPALTFNQDYSRYAQDFNQRDQELEHGYDPNNFTKEDRAEESSISYSRAARNEEQKIPGAFLNENKRPLSTNKTLAILCLPLLLVLSILGAGTLYLGENLTASEKLLSSLFPKVAREVPSGVFIQQAKIEPLVLDSGDIVNVVTGTLVNQSNKSLSGLTIEGLGFSDNGQIITTERVVAGNPISSNNATIKTLTPSNIRELQSKEPKNFLLRPQGKVKFTLVFTKPVKTNLQNSEDGNMSSFAVRVYSSRFKLD